MQDARERARVLSEADFGPRSAARPARLHEAVRCWKSRLGSDHVDDALGASRRYGACTTGLERELVAAVRPATREDVQAAMAIARECAVPLHPISTGRNWGYGTSLPPGHGCAILDLSRLSCIRAVDADLGLVEVEPGVTQGALAEWLRDRNLPFMVPTTGAGPDASLLGNALERGYGITPTADHFSAVMRIEAVLADGRLYVGALSEYGTEPVDHAFKWGIGPYVDGLFAQSNLGVVTAMTIALARRPRRVEAFYFAVPDAGALQAAVVAVRSTLQELGGVAGSVNLMNRHRVLAMSAPYAGSALGSDGLLTEASVEELGRRHRVDPWMGMGALYGAPGVVAAARQVVRRRLSRVSRKLTFLTLPRARLLRRVGNRLLGSRHAAPAMLERIVASLEILEGRPSRVAHPLVYWRRGVQLDIDSPIDPARDGCGLLWYAPLLPFKPELVSTYVERCTRVLRAHAMEPLITLSSLSTTCIDSSVPLLFDAREPADVERAHRCYDALLETGREIGIAPYRLHIGAMGRFVGNGGTFWDIVRKLKMAFDPDDLLSPGRYAPVVSEHAGAPWQVFQQERGPRNT